MNYGYMENYATIRSALASHATNAADTRLRVTAPITNSVALRSSDSCSSAVPTGDVPGSSWRWPA